MVVDLDFALCKLRSCGYEPHFYINHEGKNYRSRISQ